MQCSQCSITKLQNKSITISQHKEQVGHTLQLRFCNYWWCAVVRYLYSKCFYFYTNRNICIVAAVHQIRIRNEYLVHLCFCVFFYYLLSLCIFCLCVCSVVMQQMTTWVLSLSTSTTSRRCWNHTSTLSSFSCRLWTQLVSAWRPSFVNGLALLTSSAMLCHALVFTELLYNLPLLFRQSRMTIRMKNIVYSWYE